MTHTDLKYTIQQILTNVHICITNMIIKINNIFMTQENSRRPPPSHQIDNQGSDF